MTSVPDTQILTMIERAFDSTKRPTGPITSSDHDEGTTELFISTSWRDHTPETLAQETHSLSYFTPAAFAYFLPAFMRATTLMPSSGIFDALFNRIAPPKMDVSRPSFLAWWSLLTSEQKATIIQFLEHFEEREPVAIAQVIRVLNSAA